ncbi:GntR family transcriptional regulator [Roseomonas xinghualingensis]|uniref:GntR family transcriptional regulator n=1 Tax=Roseomonas xinghualingensis TaxID=2986475 RepID=UPI0021F10166|nr:GntR family transcriptional regulator [Roseomonas sp. SXEYE001]MCV4207187.1 GntR family transcriptional regulator [Roseomonas sp. SXEYE001]
MPRPSRSSGAEAYDLLLEAIDSGTLPPGTRLRETELADRFRISRTPVREALKRLEAQGLVLHEPHHGAVVARLDYGQMTELYHMREVLEGTAAGLAAIHATMTEVDILREMVERDRTLLADPQALAGTNRIFHRQICLSARNRYLNTMLENMRLSLALLGGTTLVVPNRGAEAIAEHAAIVEAIASRNPVDAERAARTHIRNAFRARIGLSHEPARPA